MKSGQTFKIKYLDILNKIRANKDDINSNLDEILTDTNNLFVQINDPSDLKLDAKVSYESVNQTNHKFLKNCLNEKITTEIFLDLLNKNELDEYFAFTRNIFQGIVFKEIPELFPEIQSRQRNNDRISRANNVIHKSPQKITEVTEDENQLEVVKKIKKIVHKHGKIEYFQLVLNPNSYSKTIENIFYLSFAVKLQQVFLKTENGVLMVLSENVIGDVDFSHLIISMEYFEYKKILEKMKISQPMIK